MRIGGFGGVEGLRDYLLAERIGALIDATHPYAAQISANAARAAEAAGVPLIALHRPAWMPVAGDRWSEVASVPDAVRALGETLRRVFVALGRNELKMFETAPQHRYLIRSVDPVEPSLALPRAEYITGRGPFSQAHDRALLVEKNIDIVVCKNSGGDATYGKIAAARDLGLSVVMLRRPALPDVPAVYTVEAVVAWLDHRLAL